MNLQLKWGDMASMRTHLPYPLNVHLLSVLSSSHKEFYYELSQSKYTYSNINKIL